MNTQLELPNRPATVSELAEILKYHPESIRRAIRQGRLRTIIFGRQHRIPIEEVRRVLSEGMPTQ